MVYVVYSVHTFTANQKQLRKTFFAELMAFSEVVKSSSADLEASFMRVYFSKNKYWIYVLPIQGVYYVYTVVCPILYHIETVNYYLICVNYHAIKKLHEFISTQ